MSLDPRTLEPTHFLWSFAEGVATITLNRPGRKNPLTFESYAELRDLFRELEFTREVKVVVLTGAGGNFCSGGDVHEIIGPLTHMDEGGLLDFTRMTGDLVKAVRACPQPIIAAVEGICAGAGAILAMASDLRLASPDAKAAFLFTRVGLSGADMGACAILPRIIGHGRAAELLFTGRSMSAEEGERWGFWNRLAADPLADATDLARSLAAGPTRAHAVTKRQLDAEWHVSLDEAIDMEAEAQAECMQTPDFRRAYEAFSAKRTPEFQGDEHPFPMRADEPPINHLDWPFYEPQHREVRSWADNWCAAYPAIDHDDVDQACRALVPSLGAVPLLQLLDPYDPLGYSIRSIALVRERLAYHSGLADFAFAMQGLGLGPVVDRGSDEQKREWGPRVARGEAIAAFALTEPEAGSDAASLRMDARRVDGEWVLSGEKTYISNGTIADFFTVFARTGGEGHAGLSCFLVPAGTPGLSVAERIKVIAPHPLARLRFNDVRAELIGQAGEGFAIAMRTLNRFRVSVGAAALGFARRALAEALEFSATRRLGSGTLADNAVTQASLAEMASMIDASALLIARAAWEQDTARTAHQRRTAAMAKLHATESAQKVIDMAVQLHGGLGVTVGAKVEELYREIRALRIYEGASEVQRQIIARDLLKGGKP